MTTQTRDTADAPRRRSVALVFPGQGSQYVGMGADLVKRSPAAAAHVRRNCILSNWNSLWSIEF